MSRLPVPYLLYERDILLNTKIIKQKRKKYQIISFLQSTSSPDMRELLSVVMELLSCVAIVVFIIFNDLMRV